MLSCSAFEKMLLLSFDVNKQRRECHVDRAEFNCERTEILVTRLRYRRNANSRGGVFEEFSGFENVIDVMRRRVAGRGWDRSARGGQGRRERVSRWSSTGILLIERPADPRRGCERSHSTLG